jgi:hypothetical protein
MGLNFPWRRRARESDWVMRVFSPAGYPSASGEPLAMDPDRALQIFLDACREWNRSDDPEARDAARADAIDALDVLLEWVRSGEDLPSPDDAPRHLDT